MTKVNKTLRMAKRRSAKRRKAVKDRERKANLGLLLRTARMETGLSATEVANNARISRVYLYLLENGQCAPSDEKLEALAKALGITHAAFVFAKLGRLHRSIVDILMRQPAWIELIEAGKDLNADQINSLKTLMKAPPAIDKTLALLNVISASAKESAQAGRR